MNNEFPLIKPEPSPESRQQGSFTFVRGLCVRVGGLDIQI